MPVKYMRGDGVWREFYLCLLWRRIHTTATSVRDICSVAVPEIEEMLFIGIQMEDQV